MIYASPGPCGACPSQLPRCPLDPLLQERSTTIFGCRSLFVDHYLSSDVQTLFSILVSCTPNIYISRLLKETLLKKKSFDSPSSHAPLFIFIKRLHFIWSSQVLNKIEILMTSTFLDVNLLFLDVNMLCPYVPCVAFHT